MYFDHVRPLTRSCTCFDGDVKVIVGRPNQIVHNAGGHRLVADAGDGRSDAVKKPNRGTQGSVCVTGAQQRNDQGNMSPQDGRFAKLIGHMQGKKCNRPDE